MKAELLLTSAVRSGNSANFPRFRERGPLLFYGRVFWHLSLSSKFRRSGAFLGFCVWALASQQCFQNSTVAKLFLNFGHAFWHLSNCSLFPRKRSFFWILGMCLCISANLPNFCMGGACFVFLGVRSVISATFPTIRGSGVFFWILGVRSGITADVPKFLSKSGIFKFLGCVPTSWQFFYNVCGRGCFFEFWILGVLFDIAAILSNFSRRKAFLEFYAYVLATQKYFQNSARAEVFLYFFGRAFWDLSDFSSIQWELSFS